MRPAQLLATFIAASSLTAAWPWPDNLFGEEGAVQMMHGLYGRAGTSSSAEKASATGDATASDTGNASQTAQASDTGSPTKTDASNTDAASTDGSSSDKATDTGKQASATNSGKDASSTGKGTKSAASSTYDARLPAGGVSMMSPAQTTTTFLKIGNNFTFAWNYTSLSQTPKRIDVLASCSAKVTTYTIAANATVDPTQTVFWDTGPIKDQLVMETYTLIIFDAESSISATPQAGYLGVQSTYTFAMYIPEPYTPRSEWKCVVCNSAGTLERQTLSSLFIMAAVTVLSFTWFACGVFGVI